MTEQLKPCPFCGGEAEYRVRNDENLWDHSQVRWVHVHCGNMDCDNYGFDWPEEAEPNSVERWNTRAASQWQPIDTAPKDGTVVFVWHVTTTNPYAGFDTNIKKARFLPDLDEWQVSGVGGNVAPTVSHWMPLPKPPEAST